MSIRPTVALVDLTAIADNFRLAVEIGGKPAIGVVKADAYGHGAVRVARALVEAGAPLLAVALVEEGLQLREAGIESPILVLGAAYANGYQLIVQHRLTPLLFRPDHVAHLAAAARAAGTRAKAHLKLDTGMGRIGISPTELFPFVEALRNAPEVELEGLCTHFASADLEPREKTERQVHTFNTVSQELSRAGFSPRIHHLANSAGTLEFPFARQDVTRPGIMIFGYLPFQRDARLGAATQQAARRLRPALSWRSAIVHVKTVAPGTPISYGGFWVAQRTSRIATVPVGYADGYGRRLSGRPDLGRADVLVRGRRVPVAGTICMDMTMVDVTDVPGAAVDDEVVLLGEQGNERIGADELAERQGTISYEILCAIGKRVPRIYR
ncbi:MAG TPA: alanine racemase [Anaeromyxobacteraceae bacterium]|nr:alanine racemase [Anaeromyxobacteraceae bacterium]